MARTKLATRLPEQPDFEALCAKALLFRAAEKLIGKLELGGYRANVVAYTLAWLARHTNGRIDLKKIWQKQAVGEPLQLAITTVAPVAYTHLLEYAAGRNVTEVAKKEDCWMEFRDMKIELPPITGELAAPSATNSEGAPSGPVTAGVKRSSTELLDAIHRVKPETWADLSAWGAGGGRLLPWQVTISRSLHAKMQKGTKLKPDECKGLLEVLEAARSKGFQG